MPADPEVCPKCAKWSIASVHARNWDAVKEACAWLGTLLVAAKDKGCIEYDAQIEDWRGAASGDTQNGPTRMRVGHRSGRIMVRRCEQCLSEEKRQQLIALGKLGWMLVGELNEERTSRYEGAALVLPGFSALRQNAAERGD